MVDKVGKDNTLPNVLATKVSASLLAVCVSSVVPVSGSKSRKSKLRGKYTGAFEVMAFRSLLAMLEEKLPADSSRERHMIEQVLLRTHMFREKKCSLCCC